MTVIYTIWLVVSGLIWLFLLFLARKKIRDNIFKPQVESMDDLSAYITKIVNVGIGFPLAAVTWPLWVPVLALMMTLSFLWDDYLKPYLDGKLFSPKLKTGGVTGDLGGSITITAGAAGQGKEIDLKGTTYDNRSPEERGKQTISTTGEGGSLTIHGGDGGISTSTAGASTISPKGDLRLNEEKKKEVAAKNFEETKEDQEDPAPESESEEPEKKDDETFETDVSQTAKDDPAKEK